jgi:transposase-like protein
LERRTGTRCQTASASFSSAILPPYARRCSRRERCDALLAFYEFPAEHWRHLRTTNVIESSFATVRHRTVRSKGCLSNKTALAMIFKLAEEVAVASMATTSCRKSSSG